MLKSNPLFFLEFLPREGEGNGAGAGGAPDGGNGGGGGGGGGGAPWFANESFGFDKEKDKDVLEYLTGKNPPDLKTAARSWMNAEKLAKDRNVLPRPEKDKPLGEWEGWQALGWDPDVAKYGETIKPKEETAAKFKELGINLDQAEHDHFVKSAHARRIPPAIASELYEDIAQMRLQRVSELQTRGAAARQQLKETLQKEWGSNVERNTEIATRTAKALELNLEDAKRLNEFIDDAGLMKMFHKIGEALGEDFISKSKDGGSSLPADVDALNAELHRLESDENWMKVFRDPRHKLHKQYVQQRQAIIDKIAAAETARKAA